MYKRLQPLRGEERPDQVDTAQGALSLTADATAASHPDPEADTEALQLCFNGGQVGCRAALNQLHPQWHLCMPVVAPSAPTPLAGGDMLYKVAYYMGSVSPRIQNLFCLILPVVQVVGKTPEWVMDVQQPPLTLSSSMQARTSRAGASASAEHAERECDIAEASARRLMARAAVQALAEASQHTAAPGEHSVAHSG